MNAAQDWLALSRWSPLVIVMDLDGTLLPFAATPAEETPDAELLGLVAAIARAPGIVAAVVSGRPRQQLEGFFGAIDGLALVAEHGGWRRGRGAWEELAGAARDEVADLAAELEGVVQRYRGAIVERKTWSVAFHYHAVARAERNAALVEADSRVEAWLQRHTSFHALRGARAIEITPARMEKSTAIAWLREHAGAACRLLVLGDDFTDEDMFREVRGNGETIVVGDTHDRTTAARWRLDGPRDARRFLRSLLAVRDGTAGAELLPAPRPVQRQRAVGAPSYRLLAVSNRLPELRSSSAAEGSKRNVGGLVSALEPALRARHGVWLGWSGRIAPGDGITEYGLDDAGEPKLAWVDFPEAWRRDYYNGFCNSALWPLLHSFPSRLRIADGDWAAYEQANDGFAEAAQRLVSASDMVWIHDYHLLLLGERLRRRGHQGPLGLFLHVPFPGPDVFFLLPWAEQLVTAMLSLDLIGFHTPSHASAFRQCAVTLPGARVGDDAIEFRGRRTRVGAFPIGIIPERFQQPADAAGIEELDKLTRAIGPSKLVLGVDRLDYTKGIPERLSAFARLLELQPEWRRRVSLVQISVPSRGDVPEYAEQRERVEQIVGRTNGDFGDADWVPIRYLYRAFSHDQLSLLYRTAAVGYVTPLRDGMNLVAKEYVAAQDPADPGVLVLSRFAGAATELTDAVLTNPWHRDGLARDLDRALRMALDERRARHAKLLAAVGRSTAITWAEDFLGALERSR